MHSFIDSLSKCILFKTMDQDNILKILRNSVYTIKTYNKNDVVAIEGDDCNNLGIILKGKIEIHKSFSSGKIVTINSFEEGNIFGEALVFSGRHMYPATIISSTDSEIMFIHRDDIINMMTLSPAILKQFVGVLSNRILMLNERLTSLSLDTLRKKIINILLLEYNRQKSHYLTLPYSRKKMAELLNITRPSLSRELVKMKEEGLIDFYKNKIKILDLKGLERLLM